MERIILFACVIGVAHALSCYQCGGFNEPTCQATAASGDDTGACDGKCFSIVTTGGANVFTQRGCVDHECVDADTTTQGQRSVQKCCDTALCNSNVDGGSAEVVTDASVSCYQCGGLDEPVCSERAASSDATVPCTGKCFGILTIAGSTEIRQRGCQAGQCVDADSTTSGQRSIQKCCTSNMCNTYVDESDGNDSNGSSRLTTFATFGLVVSAFVHLM